MKTCGTHRGRQCLAEKPVSFQGRGQAGPGQSVLGTLESSWLILGDRRAWEELEVLLYYFKEG